MSEYVLAHLEHDLAHGTRRERDLARECLLRLMEYSLTWADAYIVITARHSFTGTKEICT